MKKNNIIFLPMNKRCNINNEKTLLEVAKNNDVYIENVCGGKFYCGKCKVKLKKGIANKLSQKEKKCLSEKEIMAGYRLACEVMIKNKKSEDEWIVALKEKNTEQVEKKGNVILPKEFYPDKYEDKRTLNVDKSKKIEYECGNFGISFDIGTTTMVAILWNLNNAELIDIVLRENPQRSIGADIMSRMQYANEKKEHLDEIREMTIRKCNSMIQELFVNLCKKEKEKIGSLEENTISKRIENFEKDIKNEAAIKNITISGLEKEELKRNQNEKYKKNDKFAKNCELVNVSDSIDREEFIKQRLRKVVVVGNTAMLHFFMGYSTISLSKYPFTSFIQDNIIMRATDIGIIGSADMEVETVNIISGQIGSDITAAVLATDLLNTKNKKNELLIDIGTNGEMVLKVENKILACSTAAGPAFEGGSIYNGMRAEEGAIQGGRLEGGDIHLDVIGEKTAKGICGSGIISIVSDLLDWGIVDETGKIIDIDEARRKGISFGLCRRIVYEEDGSNSFILKFGSDDEKIILKQNDIRELQVAKSAIRSGIEILLKEGDIKIEELDNFKIAGTFGNYLNIEKAIRIGLFPNVNKKKFLLVGNAAGTGASMILLSKEYEEKARVLSKNIQRVELSENRYFSDCYFENMSFNI